MQDNVSTPFSSAAIPPTSSSSQKVAEKILYPTTFNPDDCGVKLRLLKTRLTVEYQADEDSEKNACSVRTDVPILETGLKLFYYEVTVDDAGMRGNVGIGLCAKECDLSKLPGWEKANWGYHGDDGMLFIQSGRTGHKYGPKYTTGDVVGCWVDMVNKVVFFTKNGQHLGKAFDAPDESLGPLYPTVGMQSNGGRLTANFGNQPFAYDIESYLKQQRETLESK